jgi:hypothetical protein
VKECTITCMGQLVAVMGDALTDRLPACLQLLLERLRNEITRLAAVKVCYRKSPHPHIPHALSPRSPPCPYRLVRFHRRVSGSNVGNAEPTRGHAGGWRRGQAFATIAQAKKQADLSQVTAPVVQELASFMRKANRALRLNAMQTLDAFVVHQVFSQRQV